VPVLLLCQGWPRFECVEGNAPEKWLKRF
jgi:hypothetical protein